MASTSNYCVALWVNFSSFSSPDGITWSNRTSGTTEGLKGVTYGNNAFVAVGGHDDCYGYETSTGTILTSPDGITWTIRTSGTSSPLGGVTYGSNTFVAFGNQPAYGVIFSTILTSTNGITWTIQKSDMVQGFYGITNGNNTFVLVGRSSEILTSPNGII